MAVNTIWSGPNTTTNVGPTCLFAPGEMYRTEVKTPQVLSGTQWRLVAIGSQVQQMHVVAN